MYLAAEALTIPLGGVPEAFVLLDLPLEGGLYGFLGLGIHPVNPFRTTAITIAPAMNPTMNPEAIRMASPMSTQTPLLSIISVM
jgi:hypothetical protein